MKKIFLVIFLIFYSIPLTSVAAEGFVKPAFKKLEDTVRNKHGVNEILERLSQMRSFREWPTELNPELKLYVAIEWLKQRHTREAFELLSTLSDTDVDGNLLRFYLGTTLVELGYSELFVPIAQYFENKMPEDPDYLFLKSSGLALERKYPEAIQALTTVIKQSGKSGKAYLQRGILYLYALSHEFAYKDLKKAIKTLPHDEVYYRQMAYLQAGLIELKFYGDAKRAKKIFQMGIKLDPGSTLVTELKQRVDFGGL